MKHERDSEQKPDRVLPPARLSERLRRLRYRGYAGGFIPRHRSLLFSPSDPAKVLGAIALTICVVLVWYLALDVVTGVWLAMLDFWRVVLGVNGFVTMVAYKFIGINFSIPYIHSPSGLPSELIWWIGAILTIVLVVVSLLIRQAYLPLIYLLRIVAFFQGCAQVFFAFWPHAFPYSAGGYIHGMLIAGLMLISLIPLVLGFTYYLLDFSLGRKIALTVFIIVHLSIMIPLQYMAHAYFLQHVSLLFLPLLYFVFGLPLEVFIVVALLTWGFSWKNRLHDEDVQWKIRRRFV